MKKIFTVAVAAIFALVLTGCDDGNTSDNNETSSSTTLRIRNESVKDINNVIWNNVSFFSERENADIIGTWTGDFGGNVVSNTARNMSLVIGDNIYSVIVTYFYFSSAMAPPSTRNISDNGSWTRNSNVINFKSSLYSGAFQDGVATITGDELSFSRAYIDYIRMGSCQLASNNLHSLRSGNNVRKNVENGSGFVRFKYNDNSYQTNELVVVEKGENAEFIITNNTLVIDVTNPGNTLLLGGL